MTPAARPDRKFMALSAAIVALTLSYTIQMTQGLFMEEAMPWLSCALLAGLFGLVAPSHGRLEEWSGRILPWVLALGLVGQLATLHTVRPLRDMLDASPASVAWFIWATSGVAVLAAVPLLPGGRWQKRMMLSLFAGLGFWMVQQSPHPHIDVDVFHRQATAALLRGENPYAISVSNIYEEPLQYYAPSMVQGESLNFGFVYPPLSLEWATLGALWGDYRYAWIFALVGTAAFLLHGAGLQAHLATGLLLLVPRGLFCLEQGWTEPLVLLTLAACVWAAQARVRFLPVAIGLWLASKQYVFLFAPLLLLLPAFQHGWRTTWRQGERPCWWPRR